MRIRKAKIGKGGTVEVSYLDDDGNAATLKGVNACHPDLAEAFAALVPFLSELTEQREADMIDWDNLGSAQTRTALRPLEVSGITLTDDDTNPMVVLVGKRTLHTSRVLNLCAPAVGLSSDSEAYQRCEELDLAVQRVVYEVECYVSERKWDVRQRAIDFDNVEDPFANVTPTDSLGSPIGTDTTE